MKKSLAVWIVLLVFCSISITGSAQTQMEDRAGNLITQPQEVGTIISLAPSITEVLVDLGLADKLVAIDLYSADIAGVPENLPKFDMMTPDMEQILSLSPDLVLASDMMLVDGGDQLTGLSAFGICVAYIPSSASIAGILEDILFIGTITGNADGAQSLCDELTAVIDGLRTETDNPVSVYFEISPSPYLYSFGTGTFLNEIIELLGGENIFAGQQGWLNVSDEAVIAANPDVIFTNITYIEDAIGEILAREGWETVSAIENSRVYLIDADASSRPNHRILYAIAAMAEAFEEE